MSEPDIQYFAESGTWHKPPGAVRVDYLVVAAGGGGSVGFGLQADGGNGGVHSGTFLADEIPEMIEIEIGKGGRGARLGDLKGGDGADGYALILTHLA